MRQLLLLLSISLGSAPSIAAEILASLPLIHSPAIATWLENNPSFRLAIIEDCSCDEDIAAVRSGGIGSWAPDVSYEPYAAKADFNGDGHDDLAVVAVPKGAEGSILVLVSSTAGDGTVTKLQQISLEAKSVAGLGLFVRPSGNCRWRLLFGTFESEAEELPIAP